MMVTTFKRTPRNDDNNLVFNFHFNNSYADNLIFVQYVRSRCK